MRVIRRKLIILASLCGIGLLTSVIVFANGLVIFMIDTRTILGLLLIMSMILLAFLMKEYGRYNSAKLITENEIINVQIAQLEHNPKGNIEFIVSCFGILLGSKVIKFNIDGINLREVEIGCETICVVYGKGEKYKKIRLLHGIIDQNEIYMIVEKFRYETGIIPMVTL